MAVGDGAGRRLVLGKFLTGGGSHDEYDSSRLSDWRRRPLAFIALVVPGLVLYTMWWVAVPVAVLERPGAVASLRRSAELTKGFRWRIFALFLGFLLAVVGGGVLIFGIGLSADLGAVAVDSISIVAGWILSAAFMATQAVLVAVSYYQLRVVKEGVGIDEIAAVFD